MNMKKELAALALGISLCFAGCGGGGGEKVEVNKGGNKVEVSEEGVKVTTNEGTVEVNEEGVKVTEGGGENQQSPSTESTQTPPAAEQKTETASTSFHGNADNGKKLFEATCVTCHGIEGKGNGPASKGLNPPPRNFMDKAVMSKITDEQIFKTIKGGGAAVGKSPVMPAHPQFTESQLKDIIAYVRHFAK